jgi:hypothetical protein
VEGDGACTGQIRDGGVDGFPYASPAAACGPRRRRWRPPLRRSGGSVKKWEWGREKVSRDKDKSTSFFGFCYSKRVASPVCYVKSGFSLIYSACA